MTTSDYDGEQAELIYNAAGGSDAQRTGSAAEPASGAAAGAAFGTQIARAILDQVHLGVALVGDALHLHYINAAALAECQRHPDLRISHGQLDIPNPRMRDDLRHAVLVARKGQWSLVQAGHGRDRLHFAVRPWFCEASLACALLLFNLPMRDKTLAIQFYASTSGLTPAETQILKGLSEGLLPKEIAHRQGVALSTIRTQLNGIRSKTGTRNMVDLIRILASLPPLSVTRAMLE